MACKSCIQKNTKRLTMNKKFKRRKVSRRKATFNELVKQTRGNTNPLPKGFQ